MRAIVGVIGIYGVTTVGGAADDTEVSGADTVDGAMVLKLETQRQRATKPR